MVDGGMLLEFGYRNKTARISASTELNKSHKNKQMNGIARLIFFTQTPPYTSTKYCSVYYSGHKMSINRTIRHISAVKSIIWQSAVI